MQEDTVFEAIAVTGQTLGALMYYSPASDELALLMELLNGQAESLLRDWPYGSAEELREIAAQIEEGLRDPGGLEEAYKYNFVGPNPLPAPPWGSVYLDKESVIFGSSTVELREWLEENNVKIALGCKEPEDHIGLMLMLASWLAQNRSEALEPFLSGHLFPWSGRFFELMKDCAESPFYRSVAALAKLTMDGWRGAMGITPAPLKLYK